MMPKGASMPLLELDNVDKVFPGVKALDGVSLSIEKGEIRGLIGPNGSGKSTMIATIMGTYRVDGGSIRFDGVDLGRSPIWERVKKGHERHQSDGLLRLRPQHPPSP